MDPVSAVGLTAAIVQLLTFSEGLFRRSYEIYKSADGLLVQHGELEVVASSFSELLQYLQSRRQSIAEQKRHVQSEQREVLASPNDGQHFFEQIMADSEIEKLASKATSLAIELSEAITKLKGANTSSKPWSSIRQAFLSIMNEGKLKDLESRIARLRSQIDTTLLVSIRDYVHLFSTKQSNFTEALNSRLDLLIKETISYSSVLEEVRKQVTSANQVPQMMDQMTPNFAVMIMEEAAPKRESLLKSRLMESLRFEDMPDRYDTIPMAYRSTFEWVFANDYSAPTNSNVRGTFGSWLANKERLYWITGKPGAGKSTLTKFLVDDPRSISAAKNWVSQPLSMPVENNAAAAADPVTKIDQHAPRLLSAAYFFWNPGSKLQKSKLGLCQTLLYELLKQDIDRLELVLPDRWARYMVLGGDLRPFTWNELWTALKILLSFQDRRFLLFIDGLDEIEDKPAELANTVLELSSWEAVKVCAASRPWLEFEDAFRDAPRLQVEELTKPDILEFVNGHLNDSPAFQLLRSHDDKMAQKIIKDVVERSSGVFLWVYVVVESLLEGLRDGDDLLQLEERLHKLPTELEDLFTKILKQVSPRYAKEASELFQFVRQYSEKATMLVLYLAHQPLSVVLNTKVQPAEDCQLRYPLDVMRRKIYSRCKCLLQVDSFVHCDTKVTYLHRTVRDYLLMPQVWDGIREKSPAYDPNAAYAISLLQRAKMGIKVKDLAMDPRNESELVLVHAIFFMASSSAVPVEEKISFLDDVNNARLILSRKPYEYNSYDLDDRFNWPWLEPLDKSKSGSPPLRWTIEEPSGVFEIAFRADIDWYIDAKLKEKPDIHMTLPGGVYALRYAVQHRLWGVGKALLAHGADPNHYDRSGMSAWLELLKMMHANDGNIGQACLQVLLLFLDNGASPRATKKGLKAEHVIASILMKMRGTRYSSEREILSKKFELALKEDRSGSGLTFHGIRF